MFQNSSDSVARCNKCQKPLQHRTCSNCDGKGSVRKLLLFSQDCDVCQGRGWYLACPDSLQHFRDELKINRPSISPSVSPSGLKASRKARFSSVRNQSFKPKQPPAPPPWLQPNNPMNPNSILNPNNPMNPNSLRNPNNPMNPNSILNPNNPMNPNSLQNPNNPNSPLHRNPFKK